MISLHLLLVQVMQVKSLLIFNVQLVHLVKQTIIFFTEIPLHICNDEIYGFLMVPLESQDKIEQDHQQFTNLKLEMLANGKLSNL